MSGFKFRVWDSLETSFPLLFPLFLSHYNMCTVQHYVRIKYSCWCNLVRSTNSAIAQHKHQHQKKLSRLSRQSSTLLSVLVLLCHLLLATTSARPPTTAGKRLNLRETITTQRCGTGVVDKKRKNSTQTCGSQFIIKFFVLYLHA